MKTSLAVRSISRDCTPFLHRFMVVCFFEVRWIVDLRGKRPDRYTFVGMSDTFTGDFDHS